VPENEEGDIGLKRIKRGRDTPKKENIVLAPISCRIYSGKREGRRTSIEGSYQSVSNARYVKGEGKIIKIIIPGLPVSLQ